MTTMVLPLEPSAPSLALPLRLLLDEVDIDRQAGDAAGATELVLPLSALTVLGFAASALCIGGVALPSLGPVGAAHQAVGWFAASSGGFFAAICAGLPSYWFYGVVAKIRAPAWRLALELVRIQAVGSVVLAGVLPFWLAWSLGLHLVFGVDVYAWGPWMLLTYAVPFLCGLPGLFGLYRVFCRMGQAAGETGWFPPMVLTAWWSLLFLATGPVTIWALFTALA